MGLGTYLYMLIGCAPLPALRSVAPSLAHSSVSSSLSADSAAVLYHIQRTAFKAPILRTFTLPDFRIWYRVFLQFFALSGPEFCRRILTQALKQKSQKQLAPKIEIESKIGLQCNRNLIEKSKL
jgi:hypothetical protein